MRPLDPKLEAELRELIARESVWAIHAAKAVRVVASMEAEFNRERDWLIKQAEKLDKINASIKDERIAAVVADLRAEASDLHAAGKRGPRNEYAHVTWLVMSRLIENGFTVDDSAEHTAGLTGGNPESIAALWHRKHKHK